MPVLLNHMLVSMVAHVCGHENNGRVHDKSVK